MSTSEVAAAWPRIEQWLAARAPGARTSLRPGAGAAAVAAAQQQLGLRFPDDLVASLERHDGCEPDRGHFTLYGPFRPVALTELVRRHQETERVLAGFEDYWDRRYVMIAATSTDWWLLVDCAPGDTHGRVGVWSGGDGVRWTEWASLGALLIQVTDALPSGRVIDGWFPVAFRGDLEWKLASEPVTREPRSVLALAAAATEPVVPLSPQPGGPRRDAGWTGEYGSGSCLTFVENIEPGELLRRFGVDGPDVPVPAPAAPLTAAAARAAEHSWTTGHLPVVRCGQAGTWAFAFEEEHHEGIRPPVLPRLSAGTRAVALYFWGPQLAVMQDGALVASFSGFQPGHLYGRAPQALAAALAREGVWPWDRVRPLPEHITGLLAVLRSEMGIEFDPAVLSGPLPGGSFLAGLPDRAVVTRGLSLDHGGQVAALTLFAPPDRLQRALALQARALASEAGLTGYPEVTGALDRLAAGETWPVTGDSPLGLRFRRLAAEHAASRRANPWQHRSGALTDEDAAAWQQRFRAVEAIMELITGPPGRAARFVLGQRRDPGWPEQFAADLGPVDVPAGAAAATARRESKEHSQAHTGAGMGYQAPVWPGRPTAWVSEPPRGPGGFPDLAARGFRRS